MNSSSRLFGLVALCFSLCAVGCATTAIHGSRHTDNEVEAAMRQTEADTLARLCASNNNEIADAAALASRERATR